MKKSKGKKRSQAKAAKFKIFQEEYFCGVGPRVMLLFSVVFFLALPMLGHADEPTPTPHKYPLGLELTFDAAEAADMMTTLDIKNHPNLQEENPILGHHPSQAGIVGWCGVAAGTHAIITKLMVDHGMNPKVVKVWEYVSIATEGGFAAHNYSIGLRFKL